MSELVEFIRGCLDADEAVARAAQRHPGDGPAERWGEGRGSHKDRYFYDALVDPLNVGSRPGYPLVKAADGAVARHIARHDPARVLAEVNAKRAILQNALNVIASFGDWDAEAAIKAGGFVLWPDVTRRERQQAHDTIDELAQCFRGEPGWRDEWGTQ